MRTLCLYFQVHQPFRFKRYRFFDIGKDHYYYDDYLNESIMRKVADLCYLPANKILLQLIEEYGSQFKITFSITGIALDQMQLYAPDALESFQKLSKTGNVEFLAETYSHSLVSLKDANEFKKQVSEHTQRINQLFGQQPKVFRNTELIYSDKIGEQIAEMGFSAMITEGAKHILGWKSPNFLYYNANNPRLKILLKNFKLSDDIAFRFSNKGWPEYPLTTEKYVNWLNKLDKKEETVNLFMDYETFGEHQPAATGIFNFLKTLPKTLFKYSDYQFQTPSEIIETHQPVAAVNVLYPISWADEERDVTAWLGNDLQNDAFNQLYSHIDQINKCSDPHILKDWKYLQASDHFYYMSTKFFSDGEVHSYFNPYDSPYDAYINYMNLLSDFSMRLNASVPRSSHETEIANLTNIIKEKEQLIDKYKSELNKRKSPKKTAKTSQKKAENIQDKVKKPITPKSSSVKPASKKK